MRQHKYRGWDGVTMHDNVDVVHGKAIRQGYASTWFTGEAKAGELLEFIGITDIHGFDLYQDDVVVMIFNDEIRDLAVIQWDECNPCFVLMPIDRNNFESPEYDFVQCNLLTLIKVGNIHQNPELLEQAS